MAAQIAEFELNYRDWPDPLSSLLSLGLALPDKFSKAVDKRKIEFLAGRHCANRAMEQLASRDFCLKEDIVAIGPSREPIWPHGIVGSITHSGGVAAASVGLSSELHGIGIDYEFLISNPVDNLIHHICQESEWQGAIKSCNLDAQTLLTVIFSAKESFYKALYPSVQQFFGFHDASVSLAKFPEIEIYLCKDLTGLSTPFKLAAEWQQQDQLVKTKVMWKIAS